MADWSETKVILQELEQLFSRDDDLKDIADIQKMGKEIDQHMQNQMKEAKEIVKAMTVSVSKKEAEIKAPTAAEHAATLRKISDKENVVAQLEEVKQAVEQKQTSVAKLNASAQTLAERANEYTLNASMADSRTAYAISLYGKISNITWDYSAPAGHLAGWINNESKKEMYPFHLDTRHMSPFDVANELWMLIGRSLDL